MITMHPLFGKDVQNDLIHAALMDMSAPMPMKVISVNGLPYLERYYMGIDDDNKQHWLHRFLRSDSERHLHSHPWSAQSHILVGWYREQHPNMEVLRRAGEINYITPETIHRIVDVKPDTWTHMIVSPERLDSWHFIDDDGIKKIMPTSELDWHTKYKTRPQI